MISLKCVCVCVCVHAHAQLYLTLWDRMDCSLPGSPVPGTFPGKEYWSGCHSEFKKWYKWTYLENRLSKWIYGYREGGIVLRREYGMNNVYTAMFKIDNQQESTGEHRELRSVFCNNLNEKWIWRTGWRIWNISLTFCSLSQYWHFWGICQFLKIGCSPSGASLTVSSWLDNSTPFHLGCCPGDAVSFLGEFHPQEWDVHLPLNSDVNFNHLWSRCGLISSPQNSYFFFFL